MIGKIQNNSEPEQLKQNLERYRKLAIDSGASDAAIVPTSMVVVDERVLMKCRIPLCNVYGACMNCPPHTGSIEDLQRRLDLYEYAIVMKLDVPGPRIAGAAARGDEGVEDLKKLCKIVSEVESAAYYDGYYFAAGFSSGSCLFTWCRGLECQAVTGKGCRQRARAYPSMEAVGVDVFHLASSIGWEIYPIGMSATAEMIPQGGRYGMVLVV